MRRLLTIAAIAAALTGCAGNKIALDQAKVIGTVAAAAACVQSVQATAQDPACRAPIVPCKAAYDAGRDLVP